MCLRFLKLLLFLGHTLSLEGSDPPDILDFLSPVKAIASSTYTSTSSFEFAPTLAIQADSGYSWANCFLSKKEKNPWFRIEFKSLVTIFNVQLAIRDTGVDRQQLPRDLVLAEMNDLSVYIKQKESDSLSDHNRCGDKWQSTSTNILELNCGKEMKGYFLRITISSSAKKYLMICNIVLNKDNGPSSKLRFSDGISSVASSAIASGLSSAVAIDGKSLTCLALVASGGSKPWLRVDIEPVRLIKGVHLLVSGNRGTKAVVFVGRSMKDNGASNNNLCGTLSIFDASQWQNLTCSNPIFGQLIYIEGNVSFQFCEIEVYCSNFLNIYSPVDVTASDQKGFGSIWRPIDGVITGPKEASWISLTSSQSWWRMTLPYVNVIYKVIVFRPSYPELTHKGRDLRKLAMSGFAVYIGNLSIGNGSKNAMCGTPWKHDRVTVITFNCMNAPLGKYVYVAAADRNDAELQLSEVQVYGCEALEPSMKIFLNRSKGSFNLTCLVTRSDCRVKTVQWTSPNGNAVLDTYGYLVNDNVASTVKISENAGKGLYTCNVNYKGGSATKSYTYQDWASTTAAATSKRNNAGAAAATSKRNNAGAAGSSSSLPKTISNVMATTTGTQIKSSSSSNVAAVVAPIITILVVVLVLISVVFIIRRRRSRRKGSESIATDPHQDDETVMKSFSLRTEEIQEVHRESMTLSDFEKHVEEMHKNRTHGYALEYSILEKEKWPHSLSEAKQKYNKGKNRYNNIVPYDHTRVILKEVPGVHGSDYINASYITAYDQSPGYIACQGPTTDTIEDFWRMIWQENVQTIVVVTNLRESEGKIKCSCYWPPVDKSTSYGDITVIFKEQLVLTDCTVRTFKLTHSKCDDAMPQTVVQFHFTSWPNHGVPTHPTSLLNFIKRVRNYQDRLKVPGPMVVHCSAGVGRTGTFIVIDYSFKRFKQENNIDIFNLVRKLRSQRPFMVQTVEQYVFCHDAVLEITLCGDTSVEAPNMRTHIYMLKKVDPATEISGFEKQLKLLDKVSPSKDSFSYSGSQPNNETKNRYRTYVPPDERRVLLKGRQSQGSASAYICAMFVDGYRQKNSYIATQGPLKHTVEDFWQLIWENNIEFIVMMTRLEENGEEMSVQYWPFKGTETYGLVSATLKSEKMLQNYMIRKFRITNRLESETSKNVTQFHYLNWPVGQLPDTHSELLHMMNEILKLQQQSENNTVVVVCNDGVHRCALFCAISVVLETLKTEQIVDIFQIVKALRLQNPVFVTSLMEYEFCYNITLVFLESFEEYANFKLL